MSLSDGDVERTADVLREHTKASLVVLVRSIKANIASCDLSEQEVRVAHAALRRRFKEALASSLDWVEDYREGYASFDQTVALLMHSAASANADVLYIVEGLEEGRSMITKVK